MSVKIPSIFSSIDSFSKNAISSYFANSLEMPVWLQEIGNISENIKPPSWRKFYRDDKKLYFLRILFRVVLEWNMNIGLVKLKEKKA